MVEQLTTYAMGNGLVMAFPAPVGYVHAPVAMHPAKFSASGFRRAVELAPLFNRLVEAVAREETWLGETLRETESGDPFTRRLVDLFAKHGGARAAQQAYLGVHRSDYMMDEATRRPLQIELNTIAASFGCLSARVERMHRYMLRGPFSASVCAAMGVAEFKDDLLPRNDADKAIPRAIAEAHKLYVRLASPTTPVNVVFVVQPNEKNAFDQRHLEYELLATHGVRVVRLTLKQLAQRATVAPAPSFALTVDAGTPHAFQVSVAYFRAGYSPDDYPTEEEWVGRTKVESSFAIKCPSIAYHLVGAKKVQQRLAGKGEVERFLSPSEAQQLRACFAGLWSLGSDANEDAVKAAKANPESYVVKPQREGGGNNIYGANVRTALETMTSDQLAAHILMERIFPPKDNAVLVRAGHEPRVCAAVSELGVYSVFLKESASADKPLLDEGAGYLLRTKPHDVDEGGVAAGFAFLNSVYLALD